MRDCVSYRFERLESVLAHRFAREHGQDANRTFLAYFGLEGRARIDDLPIVCTHRFGDIAKNVIVGLPANLITLNLKSAFIFAVNQDVKFEILYGYDRSAVIQNIL